MTTTLAEANLSMVIFHFINIKQIIKLCIIKCCCFDFMYIYNIFCTTFIHKLNTYCGCACARVCLCMCVCMCYVCNKSKAKLTHK